MYFDDILIFSASTEEHLKHLEEVYKILEREKLYANPAKCTFAQPEVEYCGFIIGKYGVRPQPEKLALIQQWPVPTDVLQVRSFLGMCGFYQRFVADYATVAAPLTDLLSKYVPWRWDLREQQAFETLKDRLLKHTVQMVPNPAKPYVLHTDASDVALGATLSQMDEHGNLRLVTCRSRKMSPAEVNYAVHDKEILALVDTLKHWRHYLLGAQVTVWTDNTALLHFLTIQNPTARQSRWVERLQEYPQLVIKKIAGAENAAADALSRLPSVYPQQQKPPGPWEFQVDAPVETGQPAKSSSRPERPYMEEVLETASLEARIAAPPLPNPADSWEADYMADAKCKRQLDHDENLNVEEKDLEKGALKVLDKKEPIYVAVRSSATTEDLKDASFAGQQDLFVNVRGNEDLIENIKKCFASLYTARAAYYRHKKRIYEGGTSRSSSSEDD